MSHGGTEKSRQSIKQLWEAGVDRARRSTGSLVEIQMEAETTRKVLERSETRPILLPNEKTTCSYEGSYTQSPGQIDDKENLLQDSETMSCAKEPGFGSESDLEKCVEYCASPTEDRSFASGLLLGLSITIKKVPQSDDFQVDVPSDSLSTLSETCDYDCRLYSTSARQEKRIDTISLCSLD